MHMFLNISVKEPPNSARKYYPIAELFVFEWSASQRESSVLVLLATPGECDWMIRQLPIRNIRCAYQISWGLYGRAPSRAQPPGSEPLSAEKVRKRSRLKLKGFCVESVERLCECSWDGWWAAAAAERSLRLLRRTTTGGNDWPIHTIGRQWRVLSAPQFTAAAAWIDVNFYSAARLDSPTFLSQCNDQ